MKKLFALFLALMMIVCLAACGEANQPSDDGNTPSENVTAYSDSLEILSAIWDAMPEDSRFPCYRVFYRGTHSNKMMMIRESA